MLTDGYTLVATRYLRDPRRLTSGPATLYFASGTGYRCVDGVYSIESPLEYEYPACPNMDVPRVCSCANCLPYSLQTASKGSYRMFHTDRRHCLAIITSEPLTTDPTDWWVFYGDKSDCVI